MPPFLKGRSGVSTQVDGESPRWTSTIGHCMVMSLVSFQRLQIQDFPEYIFIRASIAALRLIAPTSILYLATSAYYRSFLFTPILGGLAIAEASFYLFVHVPHTRRLQLPPTYSPPALTKAERKTLFATDFGIAHLIADAPYPRGWFLTQRAPDKKLRRQDVVDWLLWALFSSSPDGAQEEWREGLEAYVATVEGLLDGASAASLVCDRMLGGHNHISQHALPWIQALLFDIQMVPDIPTPTRSLPCLKLRQPFPRHPAPILVPPTHINHQIPPRLSARNRSVCTPTSPSSATSSPPDIGILLIEFLPISMHMTTHSVPPAPLIASALNNILNTLDIPRIVVAAHSYGTFITSCVLRDSCTSHHLSPSLSPSPEEEEESESESESEEEEEGEPAPADGLQTPSGLETPSGMASVVSTVAGGLETPDSLELRKGRTVSEAVASGPRSLYQARETNFSAGTYGPRTWRKANGIDVSIDASELEGLSEEELRRKYDSARLGGCPWGEQGGLFGYGCERDGEEETEDGEGARHAEGREGVKF
ncbi:hypothetical protein D9615_004215 [Tricholomella constricta]|uniref:AB hydrolase-1 domain-containing protein n=1 Tax=Tricholomella constricta TaxID=117010 RepID=A0A8H5HEG6_9AGAR|nr:hypothetical protein D9615_004215 [Tricholomella constricta]